MKMICNGVSLDLASDTKLTFEKDNILWSFDDWKCERTQQFKLPSTPKNERVFEFAGVPAFSGRGMCKRFDAQLQDGVICKNGYLYVTQWAKNEYAAVFVTGELLGLKAYSEAGRVNELYSGANILVSGDPDARWYTAAQSLNPTYYGDMKFANVAYLANVAEYKDDKGKRIQRLYPSISLGRVVEDACESAGLRVNFDGAVNLDALRIVPDEMKITNENVRLISSPATNAETTGGACNSVSSSADFLRPAPIKMHSVIATMNSLRQPVFVRNEDGMTLMGWRTNKPITITMPDAANLPFAGEGLGIIVDYFGGRNYSGLLQTIDGQSREPYASPSYIPAIWQYFHEGHIEMIPTTIPNIAGRTISLPAGASFGFYIFNQFTFVGAERPSQSGVEFKAWSFGNAGTLGLYAFDFNVQVATTGAREADDKAVPPIPYSTFSIYDNLPDISLLDALRIIAYASGKVLTYSEAEGVTFRDYSLSLDGAKNLTPNVISVNSVERIVAKMQRHNVVEFDSGDYVLDSERIKADYEIANDTLSADEKSIYKMPYSEGGSAHFGRYIYVRNEEEDDVDKPVLGISIDDGLVGYYISRLYLPKDEALQAICDVATTIEVSVRMTLVEYESLKANSVLVVDNVPYSWTSGKWSANVAKLTLVKLKF